MKNCAFPTLIAGVTFMLGLCAFAQTGGPSNVIKIIREDIKPGRDAAHEVVEQGYVRVLAKVKYPHYFALTTVTGPNEVWFVEGYPSFDAVGTMRDTIDSSPFKAELDKLDSEDGELKTGGRTLLAGYEKDLSYLGD